MAAEEDYPVTLRFFEDLLRKDSACHLEQEYPLVFNKSRRHQIFVLKSAEGDIQAGLATLQRDLEIQPGVWAKVLMVGSVVTAPEHRNQGLQRRLFYAVEEAAEKAEMDLIVLWSNQLAFYEKLEFQLGGLQASWLSNSAAPLALNASHKNSVQMKDSSEAWVTSKHFDAFNKKICRIRRTEEEMKLLCRIPRMRVACTENAYALIGKGEDFQNVCHEWAGPADEVMACIDALRKEVPSLRILSPGVLHTPDEVSVVAAFERLSFENRLEYQGLFKAVSPKIKVEGLQPEALAYPFFIWGLDSI